MLDLAFEPASLAGLRYARCGSAPITEALHRRIEAFLGCPLLVSYGLSEATCTSTMNPPGARRVGTVGTVLAGQRVVLRQPDGSAAPAGGEGEICIEGDSLMLGYLGAQGQAGVADGRLRTGDVGRFDADGYLTITGRIKDVIIRGGENISPALVEGVVAALPGVAACCVVGAPDADLGEVPVVFATRAGAPPADEAGIRAAVLAGLGRIYVPRDVLWVRCLNAVGKVDRKALAAGWRPAARVCRRGARSIQPYEPTRLVAPKPCIQPAPGHQLGMRAGLDDAALVQHHQPVHAGDGGQPVRDGDHGLALHQRLQAFLDGGFDFESSAEVASSRIRMGVLEQHAGDRDALALAAGQLDAAFANVRPGRGGLRPIRPAMKSPVRARRTASCSCCSDASGRP